MTRVLVLIHEYPPVGGGGGRVAQDLCEGLARRGYELQVVTARCGDLPAEEVINGIPVHRLRSLRRWPYKADLRAMLGFILASVPASLRLIRRWRPDVIHVHFAVPAGAAAWLISKLSGVPYVLTAHLGDVPGGVPEKTGKWFKFIFPFTPPIWRGAAQIAAVSEFTRQLAHRSYAVDPAVILNGVDLSALDPGEIALNRPPHIVFAGRFMAQKNPILLVRTLARLRDLPWRCTMLGDGPLRPQVEAEIAAAGLRERFTLPGWVKPEEVIATYRRADLMFMPSLSEGLPVVGVQALAMGLALVFSRVGGCIDLVDDGLNGFLLEPSDADGFERALRSLLGDPQRLLAARRASREKAAAFDLNGVVESYDQLFQKAAGKAS